MGWQVGIVLFGSFILMLMINFPVALALGISSVITVTMFSLVPLTFLPQLMFGAADSFTLLAIPFFIFTGIVLGHTSISRRLIDLADSLVGNVPGGLGIVGIIAAVFFVVLAVALGCVMINIHRRSISK